MSQMPPPAPNPYGQQGSYGQPGPYGQPPARRTNTLAIVGFCLAVGGTLLSFLVGIFGLAAIAGAVIGFIALSQIKKTGEKGYGLALAAAIVGLADVVIGVIVVIIALAFIGSAGMMFL